MTLLQRFAATGFVVFVLLGVTLAVVLGRSVRDSTMASAQQSTYDTLHSLLVRYLNDPAYFADPMHGKRLHEFQRFLESSVLSNRTVRVKVWNPSGTIVASDDSQIVGARFGVDDDLGEALEGRVSSSISNPDEPENRGERGFGTLLSVYMPVRLAPHHPVVGAFEIYQTYKPVAHQIASLQREVTISLAGGLALIYLLLFGIVRNGSRTIVGQQKRLREYTTKLEKSYRETIISLAAAVDARDSTTEAHSQRVTELSVALGRHLGFSRDELRDLEHAALLHDVGKIGVSDLILLKPGSLTTEEWQEMRRHPEIGFNMLKNIEFLRNSLPLVLHHHERWDGTGYPQGLRGEEIPLHARLFAIIDAYDAIRSNRPYRAGASHQVAMQRLHEGAGTHFDPKMVEAFAEMVHDLNERYGPVLHTVEAPQEVPQHPHPIPAEGARKAG